MNGGADFVGPPADAAVELYARATTADEIGRILSSPWVFFAILVVLLVATVLLVIWESPPDHLMGYLVALGQGPRARGLCLPLRMRRDSGEEEEALLRELSLQDAVFLSDWPLSRGQTVRLGFGDLPNFPDADSELRATVESVERSREGDATWYLVRVRLVSPSSGEERSLRRFLGQFARVAGPEPPGHSA